MTRSIENISDYLDWIKQHDSNSDSKIPFKQSNVYYRGQADSEWELCPSLFREPSICEYNAIRTATLRLWPIVHGFDNLERLIYFHHYGLRTRLLDVTFNPLVALYFACCEGPKEKGKDGKVFWGYCENDQNLFFSNIVCDLISTFNFSISNAIGSKWLKKVFKKYNCVEYNEKNVVGILSNPLFIDPPYNSTRIVNQRGAFILAPLISASEKDPGHLYNYITKYVYEENSNFFSTDTIIIPFKNKKEILKDLANLNITENTIFPDTEHIMKSINTKFRTILNDIDV